MITLLSLLQWTSLFSSISSASILHLSDKSFNIDNLEDKTSLTLENNNSSVVIEISKDANVLLKDSFNRTLFQIRGRGLFPRVEGGNNCTKAATCEPLLTPTCLGNKLPYNFTTTSLLPYGVDQTEAQERLKRWHGLKYIPKCWTSIQSYLCSLYLPKCENNTVNTNTNFLTSQEVCKLISGPCKIVAQELSSEFNCPTTPIKGSRSSCLNEVQILSKGNSTGQCKTPLVSTEFVESFYPGVDGCGLQCANPLYTKEEQDNLQSTIFVLAIVCCLFIVLAVMTLAINWDATSMYFTSQVILYINICFFNTCIGWLLQFTPGIDKEDIVCQKNGTLRVSGPRFDLCTGTFVIIYWSMISGLVWFVIFTYILHITFQEKTGKIQESIRKKVPWFHIGAWAGVPVPLIIIICWIGEIDGSSVAGICFVGYNNLTHRVLFFSAPVLVSFVVADIFLCKSLLALLTLNSSNDVMSPEVSLKVKKVYHRTLLFTVLVNGLAMMSFHNLFYEMAGVDLWRTSLREFIVCGFGVSQEGMDRACVLQHKPHPDYLKFHYLAMFATGVVITTYWVFYTETFLHSWVGFLKRRIHKSREEPAKTIAKFKIIRRAYEKRKQADNIQSRLSVDMYETPQDPIGLNFELNSIASHGFSPSWAAALPNMVLRRGALTGANTDSNSSLRSEQNSEISYSVCRVSVESRRNSNDSSVSVQAVEVTKTVRKSRDRRGGGRKKRGGRHDVRSSSTSQESFFRLTQVFAQSTGPEPPTSQAKEPYLGRRTAIAGMDDNMLLLTKQLFSQLESTGDEDGTSDSGSDAEE